MFVTKVHSVAIKSEGGGWLVGLGRRGGWEGGGAATAALVEFHNEVVTAAARRAGGFHSVFSGSFLFFVLNESAGGFRPWRSLLVPRTPSEGLGLVSGTIRYVGVAVGTWFCTRPPLCARPAAAALKRLLFIG